VNVASIIDAVDLPHPKPSDFELEARYVNQGNERLVLKRNSSWTGQIFYPSSLEGVFVLEITVRI
jgi:hypothetical protein